MMPAFPFEVRAFFYAPISLYICLFVCFQESGILWVHQMTMLPGALLMGFYSHICPVDDYSGAF